ncbi:hemolymph lipopolysaccharide-binding protein-like isoform X2 [Hyposmocoma kahamanoa]|uniref:hemolymph lipopolysaccharide-binding protein-like isoform X2 n=1 Tax=Hyposmocoma kahamanoa TaxID=1477025 RepID=UPI000E6D6917|nr:hemolymph lipopolysaccharide-binding protein-like isoform X2 [Hyposmocoma kahamanoa]
MEEYVLFVFSLLTLNVIAPPPSNKMQYRTDYEYDQKTNAFFKFHIDEASLLRAKTICQLEGAELLVPKSKQDFSMAHGLFKRYPDLGDRVLIGNDGQKHESAEEDPLMRYYKYSESAGSCYKVPPFALTWNEAEAECRGQGAHLIILNSATEYEAVAKFLKTAPRIQTAVVDYYYLAGFRADRLTRNFRTIFNQSLPEAGFATWQEGEPNNYDDSEYCGALFRNNGRYNDVDCAANFAFICEKEAQLKS